MSGSLTDCPGPASTSDMPRETHAQLEVGPSKWPRMFYLVTLCPLYPLTVGGRILYNPWPPFSRPSSIHCPGRMKASLDIPVRGFRQRGVLLPMTIRACLLSGKPLKIMGVHFGFPLKDPQNSPHVRRCATHRFSHIFLSPKCVLSPRLGLEDAARPSASGPKNRSLAYERWLIEVVPRMVAKSRNRTTAQKLAGMILDPPCNYQQRSEKERMNKNKHNLFNVGLHNVP